MLVVFVLACCLFMASNCIESSEYQVSIGSQPSIV